MLSAEADNVDCTTVEHMAHASQYTFVAALTDRRQGNVHSIWYVAGLVLFVC